MKATHKPEFAPVPLPSSNINVCRIGKYDYVYHIGKGYRNAKGQPSSHKTMIGKLNPNGMFIPNDNYFAVYDTQPESPAESESPIEVDAVVNFGDFFLMDTLAKELGLSQVLNNVFGDSGDDVLMIAIYMALTGQALYRCDGWCRETLTGRSKVLTSQICSRVLSSLNEKKRLDFFRAWVHVRQQREYLAYDVTSISSYSRGNDVVEFGYNRDHEHLPQVNLGMYYGQESLLPVFYCTYKGSIVDKSHLQYMMKYNERLGIKNVCFVMDRGFYTEENIKSMAFKHPFLVGIPNHLAIAKEMIAQYGKKVMSSRYDIGLTGAMGIGIPDQRYDFRCNIHLFYSADKIADEQRIFKAKLSAWERELKEGKLVKQAETYFCVEDKADQDRVKVTRNHDSIDEKINSLGYFLMMSTDLNKSPEEVLDIYRRKDVIEKSFDELKNDLDLKRLRVHSEAAMDGKMFIAFIGLILRTFVHNTLKNYLDSHRPFSMAQVFDELRMIKVVKTKGGLSLCNPLTKRQRMILEQFHKSEGDLKAALERYAGPTSFFD